MTTPLPGSPVYCSGPMFSVADKAQQFAIATVLEGAGYTTYLPQRDGLEVAKLMKLIDNPIMAATAGTKLMLMLRQAVFALDMFQLIERCNSLVFNMDGRVPDEGSVVETASAFTVGKPIVIYKTTPITILDGTDNPMVTGLSTTWIYIGDETQLPTAVAAAVKSTSLNGYVYTPPPHLADVLHTGSEVWEFLEDWRSGHTDAALEDLGKDLVEWLERGSVLGRLLAKVAL